MNGDRAQRVMPYGFSRFASEKLDQPTLTAERAAAFRLVEKEIALLEAGGDQRMADIMRWAGSELVKGNPYPFEGALRLNKTPATIDEFMLSKEFMNGEGDEPLLSVWPNLRDDIRQINPYTFSGQPHKHEALLGGATGTGKTVVGTVTNAYQFYLTTCFRNVHGLFGLSDINPIVFAFFSVSTTVTKRVIYKPFRTLITRMPYFVNENLAGRYTYDKYNVGELHYSHNVQAVAMQADVEAIVGQAIISAIVDEINFMEIIEQSKRVPGPSGEGGRLDQAEIIYRSLARRRKGRFTTRGMTMGVLCVSSSTRYKDDFLDRRIDQAEKSNEPGVVRLRRKQYDVQPQHKYTGQRFTILVGTDDYPTRVIEPDEVEGRDYPTGAQTERVPEEYRADFELDPDGSLRDVVGIACSSITPFIVKRHKITEAVIRGREGGLISFVRKQNVLLSREGLPYILDEMLPPQKLRDKPHWVNVDLSATSDRCGVGMVRLDGFESRLSTVSEDDPGFAETLPVFSVPLAVSIQPTPTCPLEPAEVRRWILALKTFYGFNIQEVTYDGFQSLESRQMVRKAGVASGHQSVDTTTEPYEYLRRCLYEDRLNLVDNELLRSELARLEMVTKRKKVDHPPKGSKDVADGVTGALYRASVSRIVRAMCSVADQNGVDMRIAKPTRAPTLSTSRDAPIRSQGSAPRKPAAPSTATPPRRGGIRLV